MEDRHLLPKLTLRFRFYHVPQSFEDDTRSVLYRHYSWVFLAADHLHGLSTNLPSYPSTFDRLRRFRPGRDVRVLESRTGKSPFLSPPHLFVSVSMGPRRPLPSVRKEFLSRARHPQWYFRRPRSMPVPVPPVLDFTNDHECLWVGTAICNHGYCQ